MSSHKIAAAVVPYAIIIRPGIGRLFLALFFVQFPLYGFLCGFIWWLTNRNRIVLIATAVAILIVHIFFIGIALDRLAEREKWIMAM